MVMLVNDTVLYTWKLLWEYCFNVLTMTAIKWWLCEVKNVLTSLIVVNILQYVRILNQHNVHFILTQCYMSIISQQIGKNTIGEAEWKNSYCSFFCLCRSPVNLKLLNIILKKKIAMHIVFQFNTFSSKLLYIYIFKWWNNTSACYLSM